MWSILVECSVGGGRSVGRCRQQIRRARSGCSPCRRPMTPTEPLSRKSFSVTCFHDFRPLFTVAVLPRAPMFARCPCFRQSQQLPRSELRPQETRVFRETLTSEFSACPSLISTLVDSLQTSQSCAEQGRGSVGGSLSWRGRRLEERQ